jgi:hypothetical protein
MKLKVVLCTYLLAFPAFGQSAPTATEAFNLRIKCKQMADEKAEDMSWHPLEPANGAGVGMSPAAVARLNEQNRPEIISSSHSSRYDPKSNRCYVEIRLHTRRKELDRDSRQVYDAQIDDLVAFTKIDNGKKVGMVFDHKHQTTTDKNLGWDDADAYMDQIMEDK